MRFIVYGAGAVGGVLGGRLFQRGHEVVLIARGRQAEALQRSGLVLRSPAGSATLQLPVVLQPSALSFQPDDLVLLCVKSQDSAAALESLRAAASDAIPVVCAQNGVENERMALRLFERVLGMMVFMPAVCLQPGVVQVYSEPLSGSLLVGNAPSGNGPQCTELAAALQAAGFRIGVVPDIQRWKYAKLLMNVGNALEALCGPDAEAPDLEQRLHDEALACYRAAGIDCATRDELASRVGSLPMLTIDQREREGGSSWQSLARGTGTVEADWLNGEIVLLGRLHNVPVPANRLMQQLAVRHARERRPPGSMTPDQIQALLGDPAKG